MLSQRSESNIGQALHDVIAAVSEVASITAKEEVTRRVKGAVAHGTIQKGIIFAFGALVTILAGYFVLYYALVLGLEALSMGASRELVAHGIMLIVGLAGMFVAYKGLVSRPRVQLDTRASLLH